MSRFFNKLKQGLMQTEYSLKTGKRDWKYVWTNFYIEVLDKLIYSWLTPITVFKECCVRTARWLPIIWKDRHWDHWFILEILKHKIRFQRECIGKYNRHTTAESDCKHMRTAEILIDRLQKVEYCDQDWKEHYAKYPSRFNWKRDSDIEAELNRPNKPGEREDVLRIGKRENYMKSQDYDYLFKHLKKHLERWWD